MKTLNDSNFSDVESPGSRAVVMFTAPWAGPCNLARPTFEIVASRLGNQIDFFEFNLDDNPTIPEKYGVRSIPLFVTFVDGKPKTLKAGSIPEDVLFDMCEECCD